MELSQQDADNRWLSKHAHSVTSQDGEDGILEKILQVLAVNDRWCVEFGSWDGQHYSNTYNLITNRNYSAVLIEGDRDRYQDLKKNFQANSSVIPVNAFVGFERANGLDSILEKTPIPHDFDLLSIDIDGNDYHVWEAVRNYQPKVVIIEFNPTIPPAVDFVQPRDMHVTQGSSLSAMIRLGRMKGYELAAVEAANGIFVRQDYFPLLKIRDNSIASLWTDQSSVSYIFFGYDGKVFVRGLDRHPWQKYVIRESRMQILPCWARKTFRKQNFIVRKLAKIYRRIKRI